MPSDDDESFTCTPPELADLAKTTTNNLLPVKSKDVYMQHYKQFMDWRVRKNANSFSENVILAYFAELSTSMKPSTLWKLYSMLRTTVSIKHNVDLSKYARLRAFLKRKSDGYCSKKSKTLTTEEVDKFICKAPDNMYLGTKVALIVGLMGACRKHELYQMKIQDIEVLGSTILISIPNTKTKVSRKFTITGTFADIFKKYFALRPANMQTDNFFLNFQKGSCTKQVMGINKLGSMPRQVAIYLHLENPELYTGHCLRRTSATMLIDGGADITTLKRHGGWKSTEVAEGYIAESINNKINVANTIMTNFTSHSTKQNPLTSIHSLMNENTLENTKNTLNTPNINLQNCQNITINIVNKKE